MVKKRCSVNHPLAHRSKQINDLRRGEWELKLRWCYRESNFAAHNLAAAALGQATGLVSIFEDVPQMLRNTLKKDRDPQLVQHWAAPML